MAVSLVGTGALSGVDAITWSPSAGNLVVLVATGTGSTGVPSGPTDMSTAVAQSLTSNRSAGIFYKIASGSETSFTMQSFTANSKQLRIFEASTDGSWPADPLADSDFTSLESAGTSLAMPSLTPSSDHSFCVSSFSPNGGTTSNSLTGWTTYDTTARDEAQRILSSNTDPAGTWTWGTARTALVGGAVFSESSGAVTQTGAFAWDAAATASLAAQRTVDGAFALSDNSTMQMSGAVDRTGQFGFTGLATSSFLIPVDVKVGQFAWTSGAGLLFGSVQPKPTRLRSATLVQVSETGEGLSLLRRRG